MGWEKIQLIRVKLIRFVSKSPTESQSNYNTFVRIAYLFSYNQKITKTDLKETEIDVVFIEKNIYIVKIWKQKKQKQKQKQKNKTRTSS